MRKKALLISALSTLGLAVILALVAGKKSPRAVKNMIFEVACIRCYINSGYQGEEHVNCAKACLKTGGDLALLNDGQLYMPVDADFHSLRDSFVPQGGETVTLNGTIIRKGGINFFQPAATPSAFSLRCPPTPSSLKKTAPNS